MKKILFIVIVVLVSTFTFSSSVFASSPYHSLDENNFDDVVMALKKPEWVAAYTAFEFEYIYKKDQYGISGYWYSSRQMFDIREGVCGDYANFQRYVLVTHGYLAELWVTVSNIRMEGNRLQAHTICVLPYKDKCIYLQNGETEEESMIGNFASKEDAIKNVYEERTQYSEEADQSGYYEKEYEVDKIYKSKFLRSEKLSFHEHLVEAEQTMRITNKKMEFFIPGFPGEKGYVRALHKEAVGYLHPFKSSFFKAIGGSISDHGFYSSSWQTHDIMKTLHMVFPALGITAYAGDYQGIDIDINPVNSSFFKYYVCSRNFDEIIDHKVRVSFWKLELIGESNDKVLDYRLILGGLDGARLGVIVSEDGKEIGGMISTDEFYMSYYPDSGLFSGAKLRF